MTTEIWETWEAKYSDHTVFCKSLDYCGLTELEKDLFEVMKKHKIKKLNANLRTDNSIYTEPLEITYDPSYEAILTWKK